jgi:hypothetical protein
MSLLKIKANIALSYSFLKSQCGGMMRVIGGKMAGGGVSNFRVTITPQFLRTYFAKIVKYALVRLNVQKNVF